MAETKIHGFTVQEKLNKMDVDVVTLTVASTTNACSDAEVIFQGDEIENAVAVNGGTCILQSIGLLDDDDNGGAIDLVFFDSDVELDDSDDGTVLSLIHI